ncbi:MAG: hypothetical protein IT378_15675 [Sandaracinaceae bacterium]|nr:hypothetical protein [Sandaracinaceae bacterium]
MGWYLDRYHDTSADVGVASMFCDSARVGSFAVDRAALAAGEGDALFRVLVATSMFQRRSDEQILRVLRGMPARDAAELTSAPQLLALADASACPHLRSNDALKTACDLSKDPETKLGRCEQRPALACHLKRHTVLLKRYGHFGKVPTSIALAVREHGAGELPALRAGVLRDAADPLERAKLLERRLSQAWRVDVKIASMFLSAVCNPDLSPGISPWSDGVDWSHFVVIDSNVDLFLRRTGYEGPWTYEARRALVQRIARRVDLSAYKSHLHPCNPRLVQQAIYLFTSVSNRRAAANDCSHADACGACPRVLREACSLGRGSSAWERGTVSEAGARVPRDPRARARLRTRDRAES